MAALRQAVLAVCCIVGVSAAAASDLEQRLAGASLKRGQMLYLQCKAGHDVEAGLPHKVGPNLHGIFGRKAGPAAGFKFTDAMVESGIVNEADRASLVAWLLANSGAE